MEPQVCIVSIDANNALINSKGEKVTPPADWAFLPAGDAGITRKVTAKGIYWRVQVRKGRRTISKGVWAPTETITWAREQVTALRMTENYQKAKISAARRRDKQQQTYEAEFLAAVKQFLNFHPKYKPTECCMAEAVTAHTIPVGSGTVGRTAMIPLEERAARAVIAWMRHQTTAYDHLKIQRIKGERRKIRHQLAEQSTMLLNRYREGLAIHPGCPLQKALKKI
ncbi:DUF2293 domain-containing protein [Geofilum sp. OHC36d9]|uniref:DUF2293 domain-containing protein n=1 Tax=Geofilum sp. OHC36d9 TaxID=3458413 RepID=UPI0040345842